MVLAIGMGGGGGVREKDGGDSGRLQRNTAHVRQIWRILLIGASSERRTKKRKGKDMEPILLVVALAALACFLVAVTFSCGCILGFLYGHFYYSGAEKDGSRSRDGFRRLRAWDLLHWYFGLSADVPSEAVREAESKRGSDGKGTLICLHPHGLVPCCAVLGFGLVGSRFRGDLPLPLIAVSRNVFLVPFLADFAVWMGCIDASEDNIRNALSGGRDVVLLPGGVREMMRTERSKLYLYTGRTGFLCNAHRIGVRVKGVFCAGENRVFWVWNRFLGLRERCREAFGYPFPMPFFPIPLRVPLRMFALETLHPDLFEDGEEFAREYWKRLAETVRTRPTPAERLEEGTSRRLWEACRLSVPKERLETK